MASAVAPQQRHTGFTVMTITLILVAVGVVFAVTLLIINENFQRQVGSFTRNASNTLKEAFSFNLGGSGNTGGPGGGPNTGNPGGTNPGGSGGSNSGQPSCTVKMNKVVLPEQKISVEVAYSNFNSAPQTFSVNCGAVDTGQITQCTGTSGSCKKPVCEFPDPGQNSKSYTITAKSNGVSCTETVSVSSNTPT